jgi:hypothetical protein
MLLFGESHAAGMTSLSSAGSLRAFQSAGNGIAVSVPTGTFPAAEFCLPRASRHINLRGSGSVAENTVNRGAADPTGRLVSYPQTANCLPFLARNVGS